ncbi:hypothetical protein KBB25_03335 [Candidatus Gracilibacteria bacterium]|nr:hypothetical protein [Candidatus Gracilibacteria bacterium]
MFVLYCGFKLASLVGDGIDFGRTIVINMKSIKTYYQFQETGGEKGFSISAYW